MASLRDTRRRISSVKNTRQITRAMKLVAGAKLRRATDAATAARPYSDTLTQVLTRVVKAAGDVEHPLLEVPENTTDIVVVVLTSDRGLCGGFNNILCRRTEEHIDALVAEGMKVGLVTFGKKALAHFKNRGYTILDSHIDIPPEEYGETAQNLATWLSTEMGANRFNRAIIAYNIYQSVMTQKPSFEQVLPMNLDESAEEADAADQGADAQFTYEPSGEAILSQLLPMALKTRLLQAFLETQAGEQASRMTAMDSATRNASEMIDSLTLIYNRARQAAITKELIEIVSGAEAL